ncbi:MAG: S49 family peptidase [Deltaproteobacteria bacterium]|nr:S49 family peptidase [Deltaproteobacteria bacterium]
MGDLLGKLGVEADLLNEGKFKNAAEMFTRSGPTRPAREMMTSLVNDLAAQAAASIAEYRGVTPEKVRAWLDGGPYTPEEAKEAGFVDGIAYEDEVMASLKTEFGKRVAVKPAKHERLMTTRRALVSYIRNDPRLAILTAAGPITDRTGRQGSVHVPQRAFVKAVRALRKNKSVKAVVLRIASPGGSGSASDLMHRELVRLAKAKPPCRFDGRRRGLRRLLPRHGGRTHFSERVTLTGSIGVISGKASMRGLYDKIGVTKYRYAVGKNAGILSDYGKFSDSERARMTAINRHFYDVFAGKVADARKLSSKEIRAAAQGRVFTGTQAFEHRLADAEGGLFEAIEEARGRAKLGPEGSLSFGSGRIFARFFLGAASREYVRFRNRNSAGSGAPRGAVGTAHAGAGEVVPIRVSHRRARSLVTLTAATEESNEPA